MACHSQCFHYSHPFSITIDLEKAMNNYLDIITEAHPPDMDVSSTVLHSATMNARRYHAEKLRTMQFLLSKGSPSPATMQLRHAIRLKAYHTLCAVYQYCVQAGTTVEWPDWFYGAEAEDEDEVGEKDRSDGESVEVLKEFIRRTRSRCRNSDYVLKYLDDVSSGRGVTPQDEAERKHVDSFLMLKNWCIDVLREYFFSYKNESMEACLNRLPVPLNLKHVLTLRDLTDRAQAQLDKFYDMFV